MREGRQLWKAKNSDENERVIDRDLTKLSDSLDGSLAINNALSSAYDSSGFTYYNNNLYKNDNSIKRGYLQSLIKGIEKTLLALEAIMGLNKDLQSFTAVNGAVINNLTNVYQKKVVKEITDTSLVKIREYSNKYSEWNSTRLQYEDKLKNYAQVETSYLLTQDAYLKSTIKYIEIERDNLAKFASWKRLF